MHPIHAGTWKKETRLSDPPETGVRDGCELPDVGARNEIQVFGKNSVS